jgi:hypothetical protein
MSQSTGLTPTQRRVLEHLEAVFPDGHTAEDVHRRLDLPVGTAARALQQLAQVGAARRLPPARGETAETATYQAATQAL